MSKHSPGPWRWVTPEDEPWERLDDGADGCVFVVEGWHVMPSDSDRRLIAKAPELLAALKDAAIDAHHGAGHDGPSFDCTRHPCVGRWRLVREIEEGTGG